MMAAFPKKRFSGAYIIDAVKKELMVGSGNIVQGYCPIIGIGLEKLMHGIESALT